MPRTFIVLFLLSGLVLSAPAWAQGRVDKIIHTGTAPLKAGDNLHVVVFGTPGGVTQFEILGKTSKQPMQETSPGRYEADFLIPKGLEVKSGLLVVTLSLFGRETALDSDRLLTVEGPGGGSTPATLIVSPQATVQTTRPTVDVVFPNKIRPPSVSLFVDGVNFSLQAVVTDTTLRWTPLFDMDNGTHKAQVKATGQQGQAFAQDWQFATFGGATAAGPAPTQPTLAPQQPPVPQLSVTNLRNGVILGSDFTVEGRAVPGTTVIVTVEHPKPDVLSLLMGAMLRFQAQTVVAGNGQFAVRLDASGVPQGDRMTISVSDTANHPTVTIAAQKGAPNQGQGASTTATPTAQAFVDQPNGFSLTVPSGWNRVNLSTVALKLVGSRSSEFLVEAGSSQDPGLLLAGVKSELAKQGAKITREQAVMVSQVPGTGLEFQTSAGGEGFAVMLVSSTKTYVLSAETKGPMDAATRQDLETMLTSFKIL